MKVKTVLYVYHSKYSWQDQAEYEAFTCKLGDADHRTLVGEQEVDLYIPDEYDPRTQKIASLVAQKKKIMGDCQKTVTEINNCIINLQTLEYTE